MPSPPAAANSAPQITGAIQRAARSTGTSFQYLLKTAQIESNLNPAARATTSSAQGLFQFIEQTWLGTMKESGAALGYGHFANAIVKNGNGRYEVPDPAARNAVMKLRSDPAASAAMAGAFTRRNAAQLTAQLGRTPSEGELYIAHFLGPDGAAKLVDIAARQPRAIAADIFPVAAATNRSVFYDRSGRARGTGEVYSVLASRFEDARTLAVASAAPAALATPVTVATPAKPATPVKLATLATPAKPATPAAPPVTRAATPALRGPVVAAVTSRRLAPDTAGTAKAYALAKADAPPVADSKPLFQAMFTTRERQGVAPVVTKLWGQQKATPPADTQIRPRELLQDMAPNVRSLFSSST